MVLLDDFLANKSLGDLSDQELIEAFKDSPRDVLRKVNWSNANGPIRQRLARLIDRNVSLRLNLDRVLERNPSLRPIDPNPSTQAKTTAAKGIPKYIPPKTAGGKAAPKNDINAQNAKAIEKWLNGLKTGFFDYMGRLNENTKVEAWRSTQTFSQHLWNYLTLYRGQIVGHYLSEAAYEMVFSALGPIGNMMDWAYFKNINWHMAWQKNLLNADAIYYYLYSLPNQFAFQVVTNPLRQGFSILAKTGAPFITKETFKVKKYDFMAGGYVDKVEQAYIFNPLFRGTQASHLAANALDKIAGVKHDFEHPEREIEDFHADARRALNHRKAGLGNNEINQFLNKFDGFDRGEIIATLKKPLTSTARRLRQTHKDPISFLATLLIGTAFEFTVGLALNVLRLAAVRVLSLVPGFNALRTQVLEFFSSNTWLKTFKIGGTTVSSYLKAAFSPTAASSGFLGYQLGSALVPGLTVPFFGIQVNALGALLGPAGYGLGTFYQTALNIASSQNASLVFEWINNYRIMSAATLPAKASELDVLLNQLAKQGILKVPITPGPFTRFAFWLHNNWAFRLPINSLALSTLLAPTVESVFGWSTTQTYLTFMGADYFWQVKGDLFKWLGNKWFQSQLHWNYFSLKNPGSLLSQRWERIAMNFHYGDFTRPVQLSEKGWLKALKGFNNTFLKQFFNPGLFFGFGILGPIFTSLGLHPILGYIAGAAVGSLGWSAISWVAQKASGTKLLLSQLGSRVWGGFLIGQAALWIWPGLAAQFWWLPYATGLSTLALSAWGHKIIPLLAKILAPLWGLITAWLPAVGVWATGLATWLVGITGGIAALPILSIIGVVSTAAFIGFTLFSAVWVPFDSDANIGSAPACFGLISTPVTGLIEPGESYSGCFTLNIVQNPLIVEEPKIKCAVEIDFLSGWYLKNISDPLQIASVNRQVPGQALESFSYGEVQKFNNRYGFSTLGGPIGGKNEPLVIDLSVFGNDKQSGEHISGASINQLRELFPNFRATSRSLYALVEYLKGQADPVLAKGYLLAEYRANLAVLQKQNSVAKDLGRQLNSFSSLVEPASSITPEIVNRAKTLEDNFQFVEAAPSDNNFPFFSHISIARVDFERCDDNFADPEAIVFCQNHFEKLVGIYTGWNQPLVVAYSRIKEINSVIVQNNLPYLKNLLSRLMSRVESLIEQTEAEIPTLENTIKQVESIDPNNLDAMLNRPIFYYLAGGTSHQICIPLALANNQTAKQPTPLKVECTAFQNFIGPLNQPFCQARLGP